MFAQAPTDLGGGAGATPPGRTSLVTELGSNRHQLRLEVEEEAGHGDGRQLKSPGGTDKIIRAFIDPTTKGIEGASFRLRTQGRG